MNLHFSLVCFFAPVWAWLAFQCSVWSFILTHSPMPVYYVRKIMLCPVALSKQTQLFHLVAVLCAGGHDVDARRVDAAVTENICQFCNILLHTIESPGKEFPQIVGKHLVRIYVCLRTQPLHGRPDIAAVHRLAGPGTEDMPAFDSRAAHIL